MGDKHAITRLQVGDLILRLEEKEAENKRLSAENERLREALLIAEICYGSHTDCECGIKAIRDAQTNVGQR